METILDVIIIGAGQAGLSTSYYLRQNNLEHVVFERRQIGDSWMRRWDSFFLNSPNQFNLLPDESLDGNHPDEFITGKEYALNLREYASSHQLPVITDSEVIEVKRTDDGLFSVIIRHHGELQGWLSKQLVVASGGHIRPIIPNIHREFPSTLTQLHSDDYRNPDQLPGGSVLIIGSATSGVQIAEELAGTGRKVFMATSAVARCPRRYRGKDIIEWMDMLKFFDKPTEQAEEFELRMKAPLMSGIGKHGHTISLQQLHHDGVTLLGYLDRVKGNEFYFKNNLVENLQFADNFSAQVKSWIDQFITATQMDIPGPETDIADVAADPDHFQNALLSIDADEQNIKTIIWSTGFTTDMEWLHLPVLNKDGIPIHHQGISPIPGLYFMGMPWQRNLKSSLIFGTADDARAITNTILKNHLELIEA